MAETKSFNGLRVVICAKTEGGNGGESQFIIHTYAFYSTLVGFDCVKLFNSQVLSLAILFKKRAPSSNKLKKDHTVYEVYEGIFNHIYDFTIDL